MSREYEESLLLGLTCRSARMSGAARFARSVVPVSGSAAHTGHLPITWEEWAEKVVRSPSDAVRDTAFDRGSPPLEGVARELHSRRLVALTTTGLVIRNSPLVAGLCQETRKKMRCDPG